MRLAKLTASFQSYQVLTADLLGYDQLSAKLQGYQVLSAVLGFGAEPVEDEDMVINFPYVVAIVAEDFTVPLPQSVDTPYTVVASFAKIPVGAAGTDLEMPYDDRTSTTLRLKSGAPLAIGTRIDFHLKVFVP